MSRRNISLLTALKLYVPKRVGLLVAVSGGADSVALLDGLVRLQRMLGLRLEVAHVDHSLRPASVADSLFVKQLSDKYSLPFHLKKLEPPEPKTNIENWGRKERYLYFRNILKERDLKFIVTAHHSDDVAETFLMRLVSNKELRSIQACSLKHRLLRPLLSISKEEIRKYISRYSLECREDESNSENSFLRNKIRNILIPELQSNFHHRIAQWIAERARVLDVDARSLDRLAKKLLKELVDEDIGSRRFREVLEAQPMAIGLRMVEFAMLSKLNFRLGQPRARVVRRVILRQISKCDLPNGGSLRWDKNTLVFSKFG